MESSRPHSWILIVGFAVLLVGSSVAVGVWVSAESPSLDFEDSVGDRYDSLDGFEAEKRTVIRRDNRTFRSLDHVYRRPGTGQYRIEDVTQSPTGREVRIANGTTLWIYTDGDDEAKRIEGVNTTRALSARIDRLLAVVERGAGTAPSEREIEPLPFVPDGSDRSVGIAGPMTVRYDGTATVDGRSTYVLQLESNATTAGVVKDFQQTLWIDQEWFVPLKRTTEYVRDGDPVSISATYRNVTFNPGLSAERFRFDPPADVTIVDADSARQEQFVDIARLRAVASFSVPDPDIPETLRLVKATRTATDRVRSIGLKYENETAVLTISKSNLTWYEPRTDGQAVTVGEYNATLRNIGTEFRLSWTTPNARYSVAGTGISRSALVDVADSVATADA